MKISQQQTIPFFISIFVFVVAVLLSGYVFWDNSTATLLLFVVAASISVTTFLLYWNAALKMKMTGASRELTQKNKELHRHHKEILDAFIQLEKAKERVAKGDDQAQTILRSIGDGVLVVDGKKRIIMFNQMACDLSGYKMEEALGRNLEHLALFVEEKTGKPTVDFLRQAVISGDIIEHKTQEQLQTKSGKRISIINTAAPIRDFGGRTVGCVVVFRDGTRDQKMDQAKTEFLSIASHQLRSPLTAIKLFLEILEKEVKAKFGTEYKQYLEIIQQSTDRMIQLVDELLNASRLEGKTLKVTPRETDLEGLIEGLIKEVHMIGRWKGCVIRLQKPVKPIPKIMADPGLLREVIVNLLTNAIRYSKEQKCAIMVSIEEKRDNYIIAVKDAGIGIPKNVQDRIFQKFFRADNARKAVTEGSGLGMYIVKMIVETFGGKIWFESEEGKGTTFYVVVPKLGMPEKKGHKRIEMTPAV